LARHLCFFCVLCCLGFPATGSSAENGPAPRTFNVGYRVLDFETRQAGREETLTVAVWYPTAAPSKPYNYGGPTGGKVAVDAAPLAAQGRFPMMVFSHGYSGGGISSVFLTEALASRGWIVVAPDHHDRHSSIRIRSGQLKNFDRKGLWQHAREISESGPDDRDKYLYRLDEMRFVIDQMIVSEEFRDVIDSNRIAVGGHSIGGYTALGLCGPVKERLDSRIKAILLFSTGAGGYLFTKDELAAVRIPSMLLMGEQERDAQRGTQTMLQLEEKIYGAMPPPKYFLEIKGARHGSFDNRFSNTLGARLLSGTEKQFEVIRRYSIAFLEKYVAGKTDPDNVLEHGNAMVTRYLHESAPGLPEQTPDSHKTAEQNAPADVDKLRR